VESIADTTGAIFALALVCLVRHFIGPGREREEQVGLELEVGSDHDFDPALHSLKAGLFFVHHFSKSTVESK
jgi:hypothetical protein